MICVGVSDLVSLYVCVGVSDLVSLCICGSE